MESSTPIRPAAAFLTEAGAASYLDAIHEAARQVVAFATQAPMPGFIRGQADMRARLARLDPAPREGIGLPRVLAEVSELVLANSTNVADPAYVAHLHCPPAIPSLAAEVVVSATNQSMDSFDQGPAASVVEQLVVEWMCEVLGYGSAGDGVFTSGGTQSNLQALRLARDSHARDTLGWDVARNGLPPRAGAWRIFCTDHAHFTVDQAAAVLGLGSASIVRVAADRNGALDPEDLRAALASCVAASNVPLAVVLTAGTTDFGAIDPLAAACGIAREYGAWAHVDASAGGCLLLSQRHAQLLRGIAEADSVAVDFHKLLFQAISCGALFVRRRAALDAQAVHSDYLNPAADDANDALNLVGKSLQTTRRFDALKVWVTLRSLGREQVARLIDRTMDAALAASQATRSCAHVVQLGVTVTNTVVLRWVHPDMSAAELEAVNVAIRERLAADGRAVLGRIGTADGTALKLTFVNPACSPQTARELVHSIDNTGARITGADIREVSDAETPDIAS